MYNKPTKFDENRWSHLENQNLISFLCELCLILMVGRKGKGLAGDNCMKALNIEFEQDLLVGLGATLGDR